MAERTRLPRERPEDWQVLWTSLIVMAACLPVLMHLQWQINAFLILIFSVRAIGLRWPSAMPGRGVRILLTLAGAANCLHSYHSLAGQDGGAALFATMIALKLLELDSKRDLRLATMLVGFLIVVQFLFDESFLMAVYAAGLALAALIQLARLNGGQLGADWRAPLRFAGLLSAQALPLTLVLFVLFPRLDAPLWNLGIEREAAMTGMSDTMEPGAIAELVVNGEGAFRVRFEGDAPNSDQLYWRGPVLWDMDGRRWTPGVAPRQSQPSERLTAAASEITYEVVLEATKQSWLFALDMPMAAPQRAYITPEMQVVAERPVSSLRRYRVRSALSYRLEEPAPEALERALKLPGNITPRMRALVADWKQRARSDEQLVRLGLAHFNREAFHYTLEPLALGQNPADEFLFETRRGFCEHYASAFALLMRIGQVPSRIVLGYLGGEDNDFGGYKIVRQSDAHAWVEVYLRERGWTRVDPTAAVDPSRIDRRSAARLLGSSSTVRFDIESTSTIGKLIHGMRLLADTLDATWQNWVLDFSAADQLALLERIGLGSLREYGLAMLMIIAIALTMAIVLLAMLRGKPGEDPLETLYRGFCRRLGRIGLPRHHHEGPADYGRRIAARRPDLADETRRFLALYIPSRYGPHQRRAAHDELRALLRGFRPRRSPGGPAGRKAPP